jgi:eukaryotic-like serine/threonine-protein kinase
MSTHQWGVLSYITGRRLPRSGPGPVQLIRGAAPVPVETTPAAVASPATPTQDDATVKKPQKTHRLQEGPKPQDPGAAVRGACAGLALQACLGAQQQVPPVRSDPPPQECPAGGFKTTQALGLGRVPHTTFFVNEDFGPPAVTVREGPVSIYLPANEGKLSAGTVLRGRIYFGAERVYGRFTEARTPQGETYTVCLQLTQEDQSGMRMETWRNHCWLSDDVWRAACGRDYWSKSEEERSHSNCPPACRPPR